MKIINNSKCTYIYYRIYSDIYIYIYIYIYHLDITYIYTSVSIYKNEH